MEIRPYAIMQKCRPAVKSGSVVYRARGTLGRRPPAQGHPAGKEWPGPTQHYSTDRLGLQAGQAARAGR